MRKKRTPKLTNEPQLPLGDTPEPVEGARPAVVEESGGRSGGRGSGPTVFEFEEEPEGSDEDRAGPNVGSNPDAGDAKSANLEAEPGAERLFSEAKGASKAGRIGEAVDLYRRVVAMAPTHVRARNNLAVLLDQTGDHAVALEHFQAAIEVEPENHEILTNYGAALAAQGRYDAAELQLKKAARLDPGGIDVRANLGIFYFRRGLYAQSDHELRWVCDHDPDHALAHFYRGEALNRLGRIDDAMEMLERASHLQPDRARIYYLLGILYDKKNLKHEAGVMYRKARELTDR